MSEYVENVKIGERYLLRNGDLLKEDGTQAELEFKPGLEDEKPELVPEEDKDKS